MWVGVGTGVDVAMALGAGESEGAGVGVDAGVGVGVGAGWAVGCSRACGCRFELRMESPGGFSRHRITSGKLVSKQTGTETTLRQQCTSIGTTRPFPPSIHQTLGGSGLMASMCFGAG